jgi:uncharacterized protein YcbK (DUF882 family)
MSFKYFRLEEFNCTHTNLNSMDLAFIHRLDELRQRVGFPMIVTSGYRDATHPAEARKQTPGTHNQGIAADIAVSNGFERMNLVHEALKMSFGGIGVSKSFIHIDDRKTTPVMWTYS